MQHLTRTILSSFIGFLLLTPLQAELWLPAIFSDNMVLQREAPVPIWGSTIAGYSVSVEIDGQTKSTTANSEGKWRIDLDPIPAGGPYTLAIQANEIVKRFENVLSGEVWICSGQSNMALGAKRSYDWDLERLVTHSPNIRILTIGQQSAERPLNDFKGEWKLSTDQSLEDFSAVGYYFGRRLHQTLNVPIGLIDNSWGGSTVEAWLPRETLDADSMFSPLMNWWDRKMAAYSQEDYDADVAAAQTKIAAWEAGGRQGAKPRIPRDDRNGQKRPANLYNAMVHPILGYGIRGMIWYQGEANTKRAYQYRELFPLLIQTIRQRWGLGDFPFYWVQLADYRDEKSVPVQSEWAELREAQSLTLERLDNVAQAIIIDAGEGRDIHPRDKHTVSERLARIALARDYNYNLAYQSPQMQSVEFKDGQALITFEHVDGSLYTFDVKQPLGFTIAGVNRKFVWAEAKQIGSNKIQVWSDEVPNPVAVRYGWADNPIVNVYDRAGLPLTPFRSDDWPGITAHTKTP
ncbi:sialate O-acetylesterase [Coraliomargarita sp. SDUM461004]|uniref:Sialate O-acetylesterase n=1 Tax=Thalassobacterium sedimentorum TaxID=3041258 RepID=A0ABU1AGB7_9BACT|nr:sialate O-acetylesterase [Coraliomargarita sp. SDUM461004]MDQ8193769.1 sialate O-acetylesterase [Coraliomargarita sp. SDUM461004]